MKERQARQAIRPIDKRHTDRQTGGRASRQTDRQTKYLSEYDFTYVLNSVSSRLWSWPSWRRASQELFTWAKQRSEPEDVVSINETPYRMELTDSRRYTRKLHLAIEKFSN